MRPFLSLLLLRFSPVVRVVVVGDSMVPSYKNGETVFIWRWNFRLRVGDVVVIRDPRNGRMLLKRISVVDSHKVFVVGDNLYHSTDSRDFGLVATSSVVGVVMHFRSCYNSIGFLSRTERGIK